MSDVIFEKFPNIETSILNGLQGDPAIYGFFPKSGAGILFDAGSLENLSHKDLLRVRHVAISHTHIDHFIGFDRLIRVNIPHFREVSISGPPGIARNVQAKIRSYLWNLLDPAQIRYRVFEVSEHGTVTAYSLCNDSDFELVPEKVEPPNANLGQPKLAAPVAYITSLSDGTRIEAVPLDHGTTVLAYACQMPCKFQVIPGSIEKMGLTEGAWIGQLQKTLMAEIVPETFTIDGKEYAVDALASRLFRASAPRVIGYVTDIVLNASNLRKLQQLLPQVDLLICESNFAHADEAKAFAKKHLTSHHAAVIAAACNATTLRTFHISNIYSGSADEVAKEAQIHLNNLKDDPKFDPFCHLNDA